MFRRSKLDYVGLDRVLLTKRRIAQFFFDTLLFFEFALGWVLR